MRRRHIESSRPASFPGHSGSLKRAHWTSNVVLGVTVVTRNQKSTQHFLGQSFCAKMEVDTSSGFHPQLAPLVGLVEERPEAFATGDVEIHTAALEATKFVFDLGEFNKLLTSSFTLSITISLQQLLRNPLQNSTYRNFYNLSSKLPHKLGRRLQLQMENGNVNHHHHHLQSLHLHERRWNHSSCQA